MKKIIFYIFGIIFLLQTCVEPFNPEIDDYDNLLVVDGLISNKPGPYTIKLSKTSSLDFPDFLYETGAQVIISDDQGNSEILSEPTAGVYITAEGGLQGIIGRKYKLYIKTYDDKEYETDFVELIEPIEIESVYGNVDFQQTDETGIYHEGYQFFTETELNIVETTNFLWEIIETYEYNAEFIIEEYYDVAEQRFKPQSNPYELYTCYRTRKINDIFVLKINNTDLIQSPLNFVSADTKKLSIKYSLLVNQYHIDNNSYTYWNNLKKILAQGNSFYNIQPFQVAGNIKSLNKEDEAVLGYFTVGGVTQIRIFVDPIQATNYYTWCVPNKDRYDIIAGFGSGTKVYATRDENGVMGLIGGSCVDCRLLGGVLEEPDYWNE